MPLEVLCKPQSIIILSGTNQLICNKVRMACLLFVPGHPRLQIDAIHKSFNYINLGRCFGKTEKLLILTNPPGLHFCVNGLIYNCFWLMGQFKPMLVKTLPNPGVQSIVINQSFPVFFLTIRYDHSHNRIGEFLDLV